jgi:hypothetical protein
MLLRIATWLGTVTSLIALVIALKPIGQPFTALQGGFIALATAGFVILVILDIRHYRESDRYTLKDQGEIAEYMYKWISKGGRVAIFTHDMSWAADQHIIDLLHAKARLGELSICLPRRIPLVIDLAASGAQIFTYEQLHYTSQSRFTIINKDRMDAHLAVGRRIGNVHVVEEYSVGQHPVFAIANDLVEVIMRLNQNE